MRKFIIKVYRLFYPLYKKIVTDNIFAIAGQSAFFMLLSSVPLTMFIVSMLQGLHIPVDFLEQTAGTVFNEQTAKEIANYLGNMYESTVGISAITIIITLWSAAKGVHAITNGLNRVYNTYENRNWLVLRLRSMVYTIVLFLIVLATTLLVVLGSTIDSWVKPHLPSLPFIVSLLYYLRYVIIFIYMVILFALVYRNLPNITKEQRKVYNLRCQLPGALFCAASWFVLALAISIYVNDFNGYSIYGGLTRLAVVMVWLYFCMVCLMIGAEFNHYFNREIDWFTRWMKFKKK